MNQNIYFDCKTIALYYWHRMWFALFIFISFYTAIIVFLYGSKTIEIVPFILVSPIGPLSYEYQSSSEYTPQCYIVIFLHPVARSIIQSFSSVFVRHF
jgi:hypothetical protein